MFSEAGCSPCRSRSQKYSAVQEISAGMATISAYTYLLCFRVEILLKDSSPYSSALRGVTAAKHSCLPMEPPPEWNMRVVQYGEVSVLTILHAQDFAKHPKLIMRTCLMKTRLPCTAISNTIQARTHTRCPFSVVRPSQ